MEYDLKVLKINKNKIEQLNELSIYTVKDLVQHYPYRFEEMLETPLHDETKVIIEAQLIDEPKVFYKGRFSRLTFHVNYHEEQLMRSLEFCIEIKQPFGISGCINNKENKIYDFLVKQENLKVYYFEDLYQKISKKEKVNKEYYFTNC